MKKVYLFLLVCFVLVSCGNDKSRGVEYVPYQETDGGQWSMISSEGKVLFSEEFKNAPTIAKEGRFMVKNDDGLWEIFTAEEKPKKIGAEYAYASCFENGKAFVSERNDYIKIIDLDGKEIKKLDKIGNKVVDAIVSINEGYAVYQTGDFFGVIDADGNEVVKSDYLLLFMCSDGKFIGVDKKYDKEFNKEEGKRKFNYSVIDTSGKKLFEISREKYSNIGTRFIDGLLAVAVEKDGKECWGLINDKNEVVVKPAEKIKGISDIKDGRFVYNNGEGYGVMNLKGENIIRAKYDLLYFDVDNRLVAATETGKNTKTFECKFIDDEDNQIGPDKYVSINPLSNFDGKHSFVKISDRIWSIVDKDGKSVDKLPDIVNINLSYGDFEIINDHIDFASMFKELKISADGVDGFSFTSQPQDVINQRSKYFYGGTKEHPATDPYWFDYTNSVIYSKYFSKVNVNISANYPQKVSRRTYRTESVLYYSGYYQDYYYNRKIPTGYAFNKMTPSSFIVSLYNYGKMSGKLELALKEFKAFFKKIGKLEKENNGAAVFSLNDKHNAVITMEEDHVTVMWGNIKSVKDIDISKYENLKEKIQIDHSIIETVNGSGSPINFRPIDTDSIEEVVDSIAEVK